MVGFISFAFVDRNDGRRISVSEKRIIGRPNTMKAKRKIIYPTPEEDAVITTAAFSDSDALPMTDEQLAQLRPLRGRPRGINKVHMSIRFDIEVIEAFKTTGTGWQTRINDVLRQYVKLHRLGK